MIKLENINKKREKIKMKAKLSTRRKVNMMNSDQMTVLLMMMMII